MINSTPKTTINKGNRIYVKEGRTQGECIKERDNSRGDYLKEERKAKKEHLEGETTFVESHYRPKRHAKQTKEFRQNSVGTNQ